MANFPTLTANPVQPLEEGGEENVIRSPMEAGYEKTRARYTRSRRNWAIRFENVTAEDKAAIETFHDTTVGHGADSFSWTHPTTAEVVTVRFGSRPKYVNTVLTYWNIEIEL